MKGTIIFCALLATTLAKPDGYYRQQYQYQSNSASYKNNELEHEKNDEGYYSQHGDLEGRVKPKVDSYAQQTEYTNPKFQQGATQSQNLQNGDFYLQQTGRLGSASNANRYNGNNYQNGATSDGAVSSWSSSSGYSGSMSFGTGNTGGGVEASLSTLSQKLLEDLSNKLQHAITEQGQHRYSSSSSTYGTNYQTLEQEMKNNLSSLLQYEVNQHNGQNQNYASRTSRTGGPYYNSQDVEVVRRQLEDSLTRQLQNSMRQSYQASYSSSGSSSNSHVDTAPIHLTPDSHQRTVPLMVRTQTRPIYNQPRSRSLTDISREVENNLLQTIDLAVSDTFMPRSGHSYRVRLNVDYQTELDNLMEQLRRNLTQQFNNQLVQNYGSQEKRGSYYYTIGSVNGIQTQPNYRVDELENVKLNLQNTLTQQLQQKFTQQYNLNESYTQRTPINPLPLGNTGSHGQIRTSNTQHSTSNSQHSTSNAQHGASNRVYTQVVPSTQTFVISGNAPIELQHITTDVHNDLSRQLQLALEEQKRRYYSVNNNYQNQQTNDLIMQQLRDELKRNLTDQLQESLNHRYGTQEQRNSQYYSLSSTGRYSTSPNYNSQQLQQMTQQLENNLLQQLQQGLRHESSYSYSSSANYQIGNTGATYMSDGAYPTHNRLSYGEDCDNMQGDDAGAGYNYGKSAQQEKAPVEKDFSGKRHARSAGYEKHGPHDLHHEVVDNHKPPSFHMDHHAEFGFGNSHQHSEDHLESFDHGRDLFQQTDSGYGKFEIGHDNHAQVGGYGKPHLENLHHPHEIPHHPHELPHHPHGFPPHPHDFHHHPHDFHHHPHDFHHPPHDFHHPPHGFPPHPHDFHHHPHDSPHHPHDFPPHPHDFHHHPHDSIHHPHDFPRHPHDLPHHPSHDFTQQPGSEHFDHQHDHDEHTESHHDSEAHGQQEEGQTQQTESNSGSIGHRDIGGMDGFETATQSEQDLTQQTEDLQNSMLEQHHTSQQTQDANDNLEFNVQNQDQINLSQQPQVLQIPGQVDMSQQTQETSINLEVNGQGQQQVDFSQQGGTQQTEDDQISLIFGQHDDLTQHEHSIENSDVINGKLTIENQHQGIHSGTLDQEHGLTQQDDMISTGEETQIHDVLINSMNDQGKVEPLTHQEMGHQTNTLLTNNLNQKTEKLTQQIEDTKDMLGQLQIGSFGQQQIDLTQQQEDLTQQTEDLLGQLQMGNSAEFDLSQHQQQTGHASGQLQVGSTGQQQIDLTQQEQDLTQQTEDLMGQLQMGNFGEFDLSQQEQQTDSSSQLQVGNTGQQQIDLTQQDLTQQTEDLMGQLQMENLGQFDLSQHEQQTDSSSQLQVGNFGQQQIDLNGQQQIDLTQQIDDNQNFMIGSQEELTMQPLALETDEKSSKSTLEVSGYGKHQMQLTPQQMAIIFGDEQKPNNLGQEEIDRTQTIDSFGQQQMTQQLGDDISQQVVHLQAQLITEQPEDSSENQQQQEDLTQQTQDQALQFGINNQQQLDLTQQTEDTSGTLMFGNNQNNQLETNNMQGNLEVGVGMQENSNVGTSFTPFHSTLNTHSTSTDNSNQANTTLSLEEIERRNTLLLGSLNEYAQQQKIEKQDAYLTGTGYGRQRPAYQAGYRANISPQKVAIEANLDVTENSKIVETPKVTDTPVSTTTEAGFWKKVGGKIKEGITEVKDTVKDTAGNWFDKISSSVG